MTLNRKQSRNFCPKTTGFRLGLCPLLMIYEIIYSDTYVNIKYNSYSFICKEPDFLVIFLSVLEQYFFRLSEGLSKFFFGKTV